MKSFNDTIAAGKLRRKRLLLAAVHFIFFLFFFFVLSALPHPVSEGSGLKSRSGPLDRTRRSGLSANHKTWLPQKSAVARSDDTQQRHDRAPLPTALHAHTHAHKKQALQHPVMCGTVSDFRFICRADASLYAEHTQSVAALFDDVTKGSNDSAGLVGTHTHTHQPRLSFAHWPPCFSFCPK